MYEKSKYSVFIISDMTILVIPIFHCYRFTIDLGLCRIALEFTFQCRFPCSFSSILWNVLKVENSIQTGSCTCVIFVSYSKTSLKFEHGIHIEPPNVLA